MQHQNLEKIKSLTLQLGGSAGNLIKEIASGFEFLNSAGTTLVNLRAAHADGSDQNQVAVQGNVGDAVARVDFSFAGAAPPSAGTNTGLHGFVHTSGGIYAAGDLVYDDGTTLRAVTIVNHLIATTTAVTGGTIELDESSSYANASAVAPYGWYKVGDALGSTAGVVRDLTMNVTTGASTDSTLSVSTGSDAPILDVVITTGYDNAAVLTFSIGALVLGTIDGVDSAVTDRYIFTPDDWDVAAGDVLNVAVSNAPTAGALTAKLTWTKDQST
jgi:hypothetical protein